MSFTVKETFMSDPAIDEFEAAYRGRYAYHIREGKSRVNGDGTKVFKQSIKGPRGTKKVDRVGF